VIRGLEYLDGQGPALGSKWHGNRLVHLEPWPLQKTIAMQLGESGVLGKLPLHPENHLFYLPAQQVGNRGFHCPLIVGYRCNSFISDNGYML